MPPPHTPSQRLAERGEGSGGGDYLPSVDPRDSALAPGCSLHPLSHSWLWADLKKAVAGQPEGVRMLAKGFPDSEAASHWSQALEELELRSRPYLQDVQRYETYRCQEPAGWAAQPLCHPELHSNPHSPPAILSS
jgi:hypothetical protein